MEYGTGPVVQQLDLRSIFSALWRRKWLFLAVLVPIPIAAFVISSLLPKTYESSTLLRVRALSTEAASPALSQSETEALLFSTNRISAVAAERLGKRPRDAGSEIAAAVDVQPITGTAGAPTELLRITAQAPGAPRAARIANAYAYAIDEIRGSRALREIDTELKSLNRRFASALDELNRSEIAAEIEDLEAARSVAGNSTVTIQRARPASSPISPRPVRNTVLAATVAFFLALGAVAVAQRIDSRVRDSDELEPLLGVSLLSVIPEAAFPGAKPSPGPVREAFLTLAASLRYFNLERELQTVIVTSPAQGDGKTTVAVHLAIALAEDGRDVILVDGDLRHRQVGARLGIEQPASLAKCLSGQAEVADNLVEVAVEAEGAGRLRVLPESEQPPNPARLIGSDRMQSVLDDLAEDAEIVIIDTPPLLSVSDALPLLRMVSGIVVVAKLGATSRDALNRTRQVLETARGTVLGAVAAGAAGAGLYGYGGDYGEYGYTLAPKEAEPGAAEEEEPGEESAWAEGGAEIEADEESEADAVEPGEEPVAEREGADWHEVDESASGADRQLVAAEYWARSDRIGSLQAIARAEAVDASEPIDDLEQGELIGDLEGVGEDERSDEEGDHHGNRKHGRRGWRRILRRGSGKQQSPDAEELADADAERD